MHHSYNRAHAGGGGSPPIQMVCQLPIDQERGEGEWGGGGQEGGAWPTVTTVPHCTRHCTGPMARMLCSSHKRQPCTLSGGLHGGPPQHQGTRGAHILAQQWGHSVHWHHHSNTSATLPPVGGAYHQVHCPAHRGTEKALCSTHQPLHNPSHPHMHTGTIYIERHTLAQVQKRKRGMHGTCKPPINQMPISKAGPSTQAVAGGQHHTNTPSQTALLLKADRPEPSCHGMVLALLPSLHHHHLDGASALKCLG